MTLTSVPQCSADFTKADQGLLEDLRTWGGSGSLVESELERRAIAHDASHYLLHPRAVVRPESIDSVAELFRVLDRHGLGLTFRSGGTSLSGQAVTDQVLVDTRRNFRKIEVLDEGLRVRVQPGATLRQVNQRLARYGRKLGPDPASEAACTIGGVVANNSSGMHCGTSSNAYKTLESMTFVTPSGTVIDTGQAEADQILREREPELYKGLLELRQRVRLNPDSVRIIRHQFSMKNTMGYSLNAFLDFDDPVRILEHLLIGSEGTLGFIAEAVFRTVEIMPHAATGLLVFPDLLKAASVVAPIVASGSSTVELLDATSLRVAQRTGYAPQSISHIDVREHSALLIEYQGSDAEDVSALAHDGIRLFKETDLALAPVWTTGASERAALWKVRKGLYTAVAGSRPSGSNALLEDIVVPVPVLGETCRDLTQLFEAHSYQDSVIFGHAKDGNVHFMLNERFSDPESLARYERFTEDMVQLVLDRGGSLKAEHGTGRIMAPYVRRQYGDELYEVMLKLKTLVDPRNAFNPGVVLSDDPRSYLHNLKSAPTIEEEVDRCVECGYCEPVCPSKDLTLTPRQRIVGRREIEAAEAAGDHEGAQQMRREYEYEGSQTCAVDGMCATACPVNINTGDLVRRLRSENHSAVADRLWAAAGRNWGAATRLIGLGLTAADMLPAAFPKAATRAARSVMNHEHVPEYQERLPGGGRPRRGRREANARAVFFPACVSSMFGTPHGEGLSAGGAFLALCERAGVAVSVPDGIASACCGTPWKSKGLPTGYAEMQLRTLDMLWTASDRGRLPVVCDASSCTEGLTTMRDLAAKDRDYARLRFIDSVEFTAKAVLPHLKARPIFETIVLHPTCSSVQLGLDDALLTLAKAVAKEVMIPDSWGCCGYAGDRGMLHPELTHAATQAEAAEVASRTYDAYASLNRTCEQGMTEATGRPYRHILQHLEQASRTDRR